MAARLHVVQQHLSMAAAKSPITTHILDTNRGRPASDVPVTLWQLAPDNTTWALVGSG